MRSPAYAPIAVSPGDFSQSAAETALVLTNSDQLIVGVSSPATRVCGFLASELIGRPVTALLSTTLAAPHSALTDAARPAGSEAEARAIQVRHRDGSLRDARLRVQPLATGGKPLYLGTLSVAANGSTMTSVGERPQDVDAAAATSQLPQVLSAVSHDLRNFMNAVLGMSRLGARVASSAERDVLRSYFDVVERAGVRMMHVLDELLDAGRLDAGAIKPQPREQDLNAVIHGVCAEHFGLCAEKSVQLRMPPDKSPLPARIDAPLIARVVGNLLSNALKFTPPQGWIEIDARRVDRTVEISVEDNGPGIADSDRHRLFVRFAQFPGNESAGGAGLGLAICSELLALHGGQIWIETGRCGGARFVFRVPAEAVPTQPHEIAEAAMRSEVHAPVAGD
jgi:PAS domain S-box-containing protein